MPVYVHVPGSLQTVTLAGQMIVGAGPATTSITKLQVALLPQLSVAVNSMGYEPSPTVDPEGTPEVCTTLTGELQSSANGVAKVMSPILQDPPVIVMSAGQFKKVGATDSVKTMISLSTVAVFPQSSVAVNVTVLVPPQRSGIVPLKSFMIDGVLQ